MTDQEMTDIIRDSGTLNISEMEPSDQIELMSALFEYARRARPLVEKYLREPAVGKTITFLARVK